jgi:hypothetical protein
MFDGAFVFPQRRDKDAAPFLRAHEPQNFVLSS